MRNFIATLKQIFSIDELRTRILLTIGLLAVYRFGSFVVLPGVNGKALTAAMSGQADGGLMNLLNTFTGGSFGGAAVFALGIMPYISASIIVQLLGFALPYFARLQKDGETGQRRLNQITRVITIFISIIQGGAYLTYLTTSHPQAIALADVSYPIFWLSNITILTAGTVFCMWLGERITDKGIGNGVSLLITAGIINSLPTAFVAEFNSTVLGGSSGGGPVLFLLEMIFFVLVIMATIALVQAVRKIPIQFVKHMIGRSETAAAPTSERDYLPIKLNASGVMPIIFAQALMFIPGAIAGALASPEAQPGFLASLADFRSPAYNIIFFLLVVIFTYVYTALVVNPQQYAEHLKRQNAHIPGKLPGADTEEYIDKITTLVTLPGAIALGLIAILPGLAGIIVKNTGFALFFGGTSLLILVAVVLDTYQQIQAHMIMREYDGLIDGGRIKGRNAEKMSV
jgi:preprotein translocase subunit SecY